MSFEEELLGLRITRAFLEDRARDLEEEIALVEAHWRGLSSWRVLLEMGRTGRRYGGLTCRLEEVRFLLDRVVFDIRAKEHAP